MKKKIVGNIVLWILPFLALAMYLSLSFSRDIWSDEAYSMMVLRYKVVDIIRAAANDVHPPLYYLIGKVFFKFLGNSLFVQKLVVSLPIILIMCFSNIKVKKLFGVKTAVLFDLFLIAFPCTMVYAVQIRMYSWGLFFVSICGIYAYEFYMNNQWKSLIPMLCAGLAAAYTHNFALISVAFIYILLLITLLAKKKEAIKKWFVAVIISAISYCPWLIVLLKQFMDLEEDYWIEPITWDTIKGYFMWAFGTETFFTTTMFNFLIIVAIIFSLKSIVGKKDISKSLYALLCIMVPFLTIISGVIVSFIDQPVFYNRYVFPAMGLIALMLAIVYGKMNCNVFLTLAAFLMCVTVVSYIGTYHEEYVESRSAKTMEYLEEHMNFDDMVVYNWASYGIVYKYYFADGQARYIEDINWEETDTYWFFDTYSFYDFSENVLKNKGLKAEYIGAYGVEDNNFDLYKISREENYE